jgi:hypothetical protein
MPHMLVVTAHEFGDPIHFCVLMKARDFLLHARKFPRDWNQTQRECPRGACSGLSLRVALRSEPPSQNKDVAQRRLSGEECSPDFPALPLCSRIEAFCSADGNPHQHHL